MMPARDKLHRDIQAPLQHRIRAALSTRSLKVTERLILEALLELLP